MAKDTRLTSAEIAFARLQEMANDVSRSKTEGANQARMTSARAAMRDIDIADHLLEAVRMACGDLPPDASRRLRTLLLVIRALSATGVEKEFHDLIEAASIACLPPVKSGALLTLLRAASGKLAEARARVEGENEAGAYANLPGRRPDPKRSTRPPRR